MLVFYRRHVCRLDPWPDCVNRAFEKLLEAPEVYNTMNGPSEFHVISMIKDWDIVNRLGEIHVPGSLFLVFDLKVCTPPVVSSDDLGKCSQDATFDSANQCCVAAPPEGAGCTIFEVKLKGC